MMIHARIGRGRLILSFAGVAVALVLSVAGCGGTPKPSTVDDQPPVAPSASRPSEPSRSTSPAKESGSVVVRVESCTSDKNGSLVASIVVTNNTTKKASPTATVVWQDAANKELATDNEFIVDLQPGASVTEEAVGSARGNPGAVHCVATLR